MGKGRARSLRPCEGVFVVETDGRKGGRGPRATTACGERLSLSGSSGLLVDSPPRVQSVVRVVMVSRIGRRITRGRCRER